jgi:hypothetical protein
MPKQSLESINNQWKERVADQRQSGLTIAARCQQNHFTVQTFYYRRDKLFPKASFIHRSDFKEIVEQQNVDIPSYKSGVCLQHQEFWIHLDQQFDVMTLKQCLKALKELPC